MDPGMQRLSHAAHLPYGLQKSTQPLYGRTAGRFHKSSRYRNNNVPYFKLYFQA